MKEKTEKDAADKKRQQALLIIHPDSGGNATTKQITEILTALSQHDIHVGVCITKLPNCEALVKQAVKNGIKLVIAAGGDGMIEAVARSLINTKTKLGIIPLGTQNNIAASLNIPETIEPAVQVLANGQSCWVDVGKVGKFYFLEVVSVGLEATLFPVGDTVKKKVQPKGPTEGRKYRAAQPNRRNTKAEFSTAIEGVNKFSDFQPYAMKVRLDKKRVLEFNALQVHICNSPRYGMKFSLNPDAKMDDGLLEVIYLENCSKGDYLTFFHALTQNQRPSASNLRLYQAKKIKITSSTPLPVHAANKELGKTPVTIKIARKALQIRVPTAQQCELFSKEEASNSPPNLDKVQHEVNDATSSSKEEATVPPAPLPFAHTEE